MHAQKESLYVGSNLKGVEPEELWESKWMYASLPLIIRVGQLLATTLPQSSEKLVTEPENIISLYDNATTSGDLPKDLSSADESSQVDQFIGEDSHQRDIVLRNMLLDVILSILTTSNLDVNTK